MKSSEIIVNTKMMPVLDKGFIPASLYNRAFQEEVKKSGRSRELAIALERGSGLISTYKTNVFEDDCGMDNVNCFYVETC